MNHSSAFSCDQLSDTVLLCIHKLAVIDPQMHPQEEAQAITGLFEGEIRVYEKETANGAEKVLRIRKLDNQKYSKNELILTTEKLGESK